MTLTCFAICGPGLVRPENQDNLYINGAYRQDISDDSIFRHSDTSCDCSLYAVADGMGGEKHGEMASLVTVQAMDGVSRSDGCRSMAQYLIERNAVICDLIKENGGARIGSTFVGLCVNGTSADIVNIGDSRAYLFREGELVQLSRDHTPVRQMLELGIISNEAARTHPDRHKLTQHLGIFPSEIVIEPYTAHIAARANDIFLLCSDGLTDMLDDAGIGSILRASGTVGEKAEALFSAAMKNGGKDNITILLVQIGEEGDG